MLPCRQTEITEKQLDFLHNNVAVGLLGDKVLA